MTTKTRLYVNLKNMGFTTGIDIDSCVPFTFIVNGQTLKADLDKFQEIFDHKDQKVYLFKPPDRNRGQGIQLFSDIPTLRKLIKENIANKGSSQRSRQISVSYAAPHF